jgi:hypothetical protein
MARSYAARVAAERNTLGAALLTLAGELESDNPGSVRLGADVVSLLESLVVSGSIGDRHGFIAEVAR